MNESPVKPCPVQTHIEFNSYTVACASCMYERMCIISAQFTWWARKCEERKGQAYLQPSRVRAWRGQQLRPMFANSNENTMHPWSVNVCVCYNNSVHGSQFQGYFFFVFSLFGFVLCFSKLSFQGRLKKISRRRLSSFGPSLLWG